MNRNQNELEGYDGEGKEKESIQGIGGRVCIQQVAYRKHGQHREGEWGPRPLLSQLPPPSQAIRKTHCWLLSLLLSPFRGKGYSLKTSHPSCSYNSIHLNKNLTAKYHTRHTCSHHQFVENVEMYLKSGMKRFQRVFVPDCLLIFEVCAILLHRIYQHIWQP